ncbi:hypothetical protein MAPG_08211 [Magnaporthiopsis poae ATCC 64411]|uniref:Uncharacterized protein n=1 Tax=Magnaporthiopsis poae (strain ATCC 64411 / 73-15) TaxID=644358 RepID=A0A0C4E6R5_MAGP6|nr:hypothetical protein MAPG_08211 [Magnaporthiopsis poae ATCC 64411]
MCLGRTALRPAASRSLGSPQTPIPRDKPAQHGPTRLQQRLGSGRVLATGFLPEQLGAGLDTALNITLSSNLSSNVRLSCSVSLVPTLTPSFGLLIVPKGGSVCTCFQLVTLGRREA